MIRKISSQAFTLLELSLVILIISLIIGSITVGNTLVQDSNIKNSITSLQSYQIAVNAFKNIYQAIPGDMSNATSYFPNAAANGNGDGFNSCTGSGSECWLAWNHLMYAGLITGNYNGSNQGPTLSINNSTMLYVWSAGPNANGITANQANYNLTLGYVLIGALTNSTVIQASLIDNKIDDNIPTQGVIISIRSNSSSTPFCIKQSDGTTDADLTYKGKGSYYVTPNSTLSCGLNIAVGS